MAEPKFETFAREKMRTLDNAYSALMEERERIEMDEFEDLYDVESDKETIKEFEKKFEQDPTLNKEADYFTELFEALFTDLAEKGRWFDEAVIQNASRYDDVVNGIDIIAEFQKEGMFSHLGFAIDLTFSNKIRFKLNRIKREIESGELAKIKYYLSSEEAGVRGELRNVPRVIVGADVNSIKNLTSLWFQKRQISESIDEAGQTANIKKAMQSKLKEAVDNLKGHDIQHRVLRQIEFQLEKFIEFARKEEKTEVAEKLQTSLDKVRQIMDIKGTPELEDDFLDLLEEEIEAVFEKREYGL
jgi:hypothetical protein